MIGSEKWKHEAKPKRKTLKNNNNVIQLSVPECVVKNHQNCNKRVAMKKASASDSSFEVNGQ